MTRKLFITVILGIGALVLGAQSALAKPPELTSVTSMIQARENALGRDFQLGDFAVNNTWSGAPSMIQARAKALGRDFQLGDFAVNNTWSGVISTTSSNATPQSLKAERARSEGLNRMYGLGEYSAPIVGDDRFRIDQSNVPVPVSASSSGNEIEWPQIGIGFGVGLVLILGLALTLRATHTRPFAH